MIKVDVSQAILKLDEIVLEFIPTSTPGHTATRQAATGVAKNIIGTMQVKETKRGEFF